MENKQEINPLYSSAVKLLYVRYREFLVGVVLLIGDILRFDASNLDPEVLKSRRNLLVLSLISIIIFYISPDISEVSIATIKLKVAQYEKVKLFILAVLAFEIVNFILRSFVYISRDIVKREYERAYREMEQPTNFVTKSNDSSFLFGGSSARSLLLQAEENDSRSSFARAVLSNFTEIYIPLIIAIVSLVWGVVEVCPYFTRHFI